MVRGAGGGACGCVFVAAMVASRSRRSSLRYILSSLNSYQMLYLVK